MFTVRIEALFACILCFLEKIRQCDIDEEDNYGRQYRRELKFIYSTIEFWRNYEISMCPGKRFVKEKNYGKIMKLRMKMSEKYTA